MHRENGTKSGTGVWSLMLALALLVLVPACGGGGDNGAGATEAGGSGRPASKYEEDVRAVAALFDSAAKRLGPPHSSERTKEEVPKAADELNEAVARVEQATPPAKATDANAKLLWSAWAARDAAENARLTVADGYELTAADRNQILDAIGDAEQALKDLRRLGFDVRTTR
ncbi:MAG: hypothetical protein ICV64_05530 [Thermoleophilia bacterium]|nr:hypothetical protein [Thermoleophilia bacterium]